MNIPDFVKKREDSNQGFDLYFAGAVNKHLECWFDRTQALKLFTQVTDKKAIKIHIDKCPNNKIFLDSGAWAAHSRGVSLDVDGYINYANSISDYVNAIAQVDHIPGVYRQVKTREQLLEAPKLSWKNYLYMKDKMKDRDKLLPIFHQGEDFKYLYQILNYKHSDGNYIDYIGISPANDSSVTDKINFMDKCFNIILNSDNYNVKTHAFGMTSLYLLEQYPFYSADSAGWVKKAAYGFVYIPMPNYKRGEMSYKLIGFGNRVNAPDHYINQDKYTQNYIQHYLKSIETSVEQLYTDGNCRCLANCKYLYNWAKEYKYSGKLLNSYRLF